MSLSNPNTVVTEQRLSEFYQGILPYLGGMPEMLANKFSKGDLYSTEEKMIGQWVDGKPLYQRTIVDTMPSEPVSATYASKAIDIGASVEYAQVTDMIIQDSSAYISAFYATNDMSKYAKCFACSNSYSSTPNKLMINCNSWYTKTCFITVQYTKTTDSAISIGSDTDYSTEEKIIGTWIDGKPIYQKTWVFQNALSLESNVWTDSVIPSAGIDSIIDCKGKNGITFNGDLMVTITTSGYVKLLSNRATTNVITMVTLQYTKTTN